jgi:glycosyltransferase involved in cell wall biosynthesis
MNLATFAVVLLLAASALAALPVLVLAVELALARPRMPPRREGADGDRAGIRVAVLIPAHNEGSGISATLRSLRPQLRSGDRLLVVADNCGDDTAQVASSEGAEVVERSDTVNRGKGYALDFGVRYLAADPPRVLIIVDADCIVHPGSVDALALRCVAHNRPLQSLNLMKAAGDSLRLRWAEFAWRIMNHARPDGMSRLGGPCPLKGTGMAFPWPQIHGAPLASGHLAEDMVLGVELALAGHAAAFEPHALVTSEFPTTDDAARVQRTRWEHGHLATLLRHGPRLVAAGLRRRNADCVLLGLDLMVPPLSLLLMLQVALLVLGLLAGVPLVSATALALMLISIVWAWWRFGRDLIAGRELLAAPWYLLAKLPIYLRFALRRQSQWVRTRREGDR